MARSDFLLVDNMTSTVQYDCIMESILITLSVLFFSVCDVLPHLLASHNMTVDTSSANGSQDDEVCAISNPLTQPSLSLKQDKTRQLYYILTRFTVTTDLAPQIAD